MERPGCKMKEKLSEGQKFKLSPTRGLGQAKAEGRNASGRGITCAQALRPEGAQPDPGTRLMEQPVQGAHSGAR